MVQACLWVAFAISVLILVYYAWCTYKGHCGWEVSGQHRSLDNTVQASKADETGQLAACSVDPQQQLQQAH